MDVESVVALMDQSGACIDDLWAAGGGHLAQPAQPAQGPAETSGTDGDNKV